MPRLSTRILAAAMGVGLSTGLAEIASAQAPLFPSEIMLSGQPAMVPEIGADFDGDGLVDLLTTAGGTLGQGGGDFGAPIALPALPTGLGPFLTRVATRVVDLNGDGVPDLGCLVGGTALSIATWVGNGDGTFQPPSVVTVLASNVTAVQDLRFADLDRDGNNDAVYAGSNIGVAPPAGTTRILLGNGDGSLRAPVLLNAEIAGRPGSTPFLLAVGDLDGDQDPDIVFAEHTALSPGSLRILLGHGNGTFAPATYQSALTRPYGLAFGDFDGDGRADLAAAHIEGLARRIQIFRGSAAGTLQPPTLVELGNGWPTAGVFATADQDGDGVLDLLSAGQGVLRIARGQGDGSFLPSAPLPTSSTPNGIAVGAVDADGLLDLVVTTSGTSGPWVFRGENGGGLTHPISDPRHRPIPKRVTALFPGRIDGDLYRDLALIERPAPPDTTASLRVLLGNGDGSFRDGPVTPLSGSQHAIAADFDLDGLLDVVTTTSSPSTLTLHRSLGDGTFASVTQSVFPTSVGRFVVDDLNGDGFPDLAIAPSGSPFVSVAFGPAVVPAPYPAITLATTSSRFLALGRLDGDAHPDLVAATSGSAVVEVAFGTGDGTFASPQPLDVPPFVSDLEIADLDGDGTNDLVVVASTAAELAWLRGLGNGQFEPAVPIPASGAQPDSLVVRDLDGDGTRDLLFAEYATSGQLIVLQGQGAASFGAPRRFALTASLAASELGSSGSVPLALADFDSDSYPDLLYAVTPTSTAGSELGMLVNLSPQAVPEAELLVGGILVGIGLLGAIGPGRGRRRSAGSNDRHADPAESGRSGAVAWDQDRLREQSARRR